MDGSERTAITNDGIYWPNGKKFFQNYFEASSFEIFRDFLDILSFPTLIISIINLFTS